MESYLTKTNAKRVLDSSLFIIFDIFFASSRHEYNLNVQKKNRLTVNKNKNLFIIVSMTYYFMTDEIPLLLYIMKFHLLIIIL